MGAKQMATVTREDRERVAAATSAEWQSYPDWAAWVEGNRAAAEYIGENEFAQMAAELRERAEKAEAECAEWRKKGVFWPLHKPYEDQADHYRERAENAERELAELKAKLEAAQRGQLDCQAALASAEAELEALMLAQRCAQRCAPEDVIRAALAAAGVEMPE